MSQARLTKQELVNASEALANWFISQELSLGNSAIVMVHLLSVMTADRATDAKDLEVGIKDLNASLTYQSANAFVVKHNIKL